MSAITLSSQGWNRIPKEDIDEDFCFIFPDRTYKCNKLFAEFLSPKVSGLRATDRSISCLNVSIKDGGIFDEILKLCYGRSIHIDEGNCSIVCDIASELENGELLDLAINYSGDLGIDNAIGRLSRKWKHHCDYESEVDFVSKHFYEFDDDSLSSLDCSCLSFILNQKSLSLKNEDSLLKFLLSYIESKGEGSDLLQYVFFEYVSAPVLSRLFELWKQSPIDFNQHSISSLQRRICSKRALLPTERHREPLMKCQLSSEFCFEASKRNSVSFSHENGPLNGIIQYLSLQCGNVIDKHVIDGLCSSIYQNDQSYAPHTMVDFHCDRPFESENFAGSYVGYDFKEKRVIPTAYTLQAGGSGWMPSYHPKSWVLEVSNDGVQWTEVDKHENTNDLKDLCAMKTYTIQKSLECRYIRIKQTGPNHGGQHYLTIGAFEIFGDLITK